jgi:hypothetical protein
MYDAKGLKSAHVHCTAVAATDGPLIEIPTSDARAS